MKFGVSKENFELWRRIRSFEDEEAAVCIRHLPKLGKAVATKTQGRANPSPSMRRYLTLVAAAADIHVPMEAQ